MSAGTGVESGVESMPAEAGTPGAGEPGVPGAGVRWTWVGVISTGTVSGWKAISSCSMRLLTSGSSQYLIESSSNAARR